MLMLIFIEADCEQLLNVLSELLLNRGSRDYLKFKDKSLKNSIAIDDLLQSLYEVLLRFEI